MYPALPPRAQRRKASDSSSPAPAPLVRDSNNLTRKASPRLRLELQQARVQTFHASRESDAYIKAYHAIGRGTLPPCAAATRSPYTRASSKNPAVQGHPLARSHQTHRSTASAVSDGFVLKQTFVEAGAFRWMTLISF